MVRVFAIGNYEKTESHKQYNTCYTYRTNSEIHFVRRTLFILYNNKFITIQYFLLFFYHCKIVDEKICSMFVNFRRQSIITSGVYLSEK